jgi:2-amino-4-hydroxy-6-hydroxymethyldihydropteridine diphosphokinase
MSGIQKVYISTGSNLGDRKAYLDRAVSALARIGAISQISPCFETEPVGFPDQPWFLNQAIELETRLSPRRLLKYCQRIEASCGRSRTFPNAPRTLDIDILLYGDLLINSPDLVIPHPRLVDRRFVLEPLARIASHVMHPALGKSIGSLLEACRDSSEVRLATKPVRDSG